MAQKDEVAGLKAQIQEMREALAALGIRSPRQAGEAEVQTDRIEFGSPEHAAFLGLVEVIEGDDTIALATYTSPRTGKAYRIEDEIGVIARYPHAHPEHAVRLSLQQKVGELESKPAVPADAPPMWVP